MLYQTIGRLSVILIAVVALILAGAVQLGGFAQTDVLVFSARSRLDPFAIYVLDVHHNSTIRLTNIDGQAVEPSWSPDGTQIAYTFIAPDGQMDIWTVDARRRNLQQLTDTGQYERAPSWSRDGQQIAYIYASDSERFPNVYLMRADGMETRQLTDRSAMDNIIAWSPDSETLIFESMDVGPYIQRLYRVDVAGGEPQQLTGLDGEGSYASQPTWSADGNWVAYVIDDTELWMMQPDGRYQHYLTSHGSDCAIVSPSWSPDNRRIAYGVQCNFDTPAIYIYDVINATHQVIEQNGMTIVDVAWHPK